MKARSENSAMAQGLQHRFDAAHGLQGIGRQGKGSRAPNFGSLQFATLALCGECGELANALKKVIRAHALGEPSAAAFDNARGELADIYAYLLKLASLLDVNLEEEYLETVGLNCLRFSIANRRPLKRVIGIGGRGAVEFARGLSSTMPAKERARIDCLVLPTPPMTNAGRYLAWLRLARAKIGARLSSSSPGFLLVINDPALGTVLYRSALAKRTNDACTPLLRHWLSIEELLWEKASSRTLLLLQDAAAPPVVEKLLNHGARIIPNDADWPMILKTTAAQRKRL
jgi:NTP pyrophosphatase (non-canonical NTP hydrolase)